MKNIEQEVGEGISNEQLDYVDTLINRNLSDVAAKSRVLESD